MREGIRRGIRLGACGMAAAIGLLAAAGLRAEEAPQVYTGTLGDQSVVVELDLTQPNEVTGRYFYQKYHLDLPLSGTLVNHDLSMSEGLDALDDTPHPTISLQPAEQGWQGEWRSPQGKVLPLQLTQAHPTAAAGEDAYLATLADSDPYEYLRLHGLRLQRDKPQTVMGYAIQWWREPQSGIRLFEILSGYPPAQLEALNRQLRARLWQEVVDYHACQLGASRFGQGEFSQTVTPTLLSPAVVSVSVFTSYDCGGAHPDFGDAPLNLNAQTGEKLALEDVLWLGEGKPFHYLYEENNFYDGGQDTNETTDSVSFDDYAAYRSHTLAPWLVRQFQTLYPEQMAVPAEEDEDGCNFSDPEIWNFPAWYFTPQGIWFGPSFARVMRACEGESWSVLPWKQITGHPGGVALALPK